MEDLGRWVMLLVNPVWRFRAATATVGSGRQAGRRGRVSAMRVPLTAFISIRVPLTAAQPATLSHRQTA